MNLTARPLTAEIESAAPPRASPSILVSTRPVTGVFSWKASATATASWPTMASTTSSVSLGWTASWTSRISAISASSTWRRPAVSRMTTSRPVCLAWATAPVAMSTTRVPGRGAVDRDVEALAQRLELLDGGRPIEVGRDQQRLAALAHDPARQLGRGGRLARALQADHGDDRRRAVVAEGAVALRRGWP